jgi:hypothetical protein
MIHVYNVLPYVAVFVVPFTLTVMTATHAQDLSTSFGVGVTLAINVDGVGKTSTS